MPKDQPRATWRETIPEKEEDYIAFSTTLKDGHCNAAAFLEIKTFDYLFLKGL